MLAQNPKEGDEYSQLKEVFMGADSEAETFIVNQKPGFHFHNSAWSENEFHQDCACALSVMLGQNDTKYANYEHKISFWQMVENPLLIEQAAE